MLRKVIKQKSYSQNKYQKSFIGIKSQLFNEKPGDRNQRYINFRILGVNYKTVIIFI